MKTLVVFYSRTGKTKFIAEQIAKELKADVEELIDKKNRKGILGWLISGHDAFREKLTEIEKPKYNINNYDLVFIGSPVWAGKPAPAIRTYLEKNQPKKVCLFCTYDGTGDVKALNRTAFLIKIETISKKSFKKPLKNKEKTINKVKEWLKEINSH